MNFISQERKPAVKNEMRRPAGQARPVKGGQPSPSMQFFGPSDFVPELPHNVQVPAQGLDCFHAVANQCLVRVGWSDCRVEPGGLRELAAC